MFRCNLRTLLIVLAIGPPLIGFWPAIKKSAVERMTQITASDVAVVGVLSLLRDFGYAAPSFFAALGALASITAAWIAWRLRSTPDLAHGQT